MTEIHVQKFYDMLLECYGLSGWRFSPELQLEYTNSQLPNLHQALLLGHGRGEAIAEHAASSDEPMIISDRIGLMWGVVEKREGRPENTGVFYILGPMLIKEMDKSTLESLVNPLNLSLQHKWELIHDLSLLPHVPIVHFLQMIVMLHYYVNGRKSRPSHFDYYTPRQAQKTDRRDMDQEDMPHASPLTERRLLDMVRTGNLDYHTVLAEAGSVSPGIRVNCSDPILQAKYSVVAFITLCTRAAIEGGLSSEIAYTLSDTYTQSVDNAQSVSQVAAVSHTMYEDFIRRVNRIRRESGVSRPVRICCDYIDANPEGDLSLSRLARRVGYAQSYLARKFKEELGLSVGAYVRMARVHQAKALLISTDMSIQEIADRLHFCSGSYFAEAFRKEAGISPSDYREKIVKEGG